MPPWKLRDRRRLISLTRAPVNFVAVTAAVTADATPHVKGAWSEVVASTAGEASLARWYVNTSAQSTVDTGSLMDIGIGPAGSEVVILENLHAGCLADQHSWDIPLHIPEGSRIAARVQSKVASKAFSVGCDLYGGQGLDLATAQPLHHVGTLLADTATSSGSVVISGGAGANSTGTWQELLASAPFDIDAMFVTWGINTTSMASGSSFRPQLAVGPAGSEVIVWDMPLMRTSSNEGFDYYGNPDVMSPDLGVKAGDRLAMRVGNSTANQQGRPVLHCFRR